VKKNLYVLFSVDWEPDHGKWRAEGAEHDYGGILVGTRALEKLLDELNVPCTWFIEASHDPRRDLPSLFPLIVERIAARARDEAGLHIHWRRGKTGNGLVYETRDTSWVKCQIEQGVQSLLSCGIRPKSFRGGSFLHVEKLALVLSDASFSNDSTVLWNRCHRLNAERTAEKSEPRLGRFASQVHRLCGVLPRPYFTGPEDVESVGDSPILEFPVYYNPLDLTCSWRNFLHRTVVRRATTLNSGPSFISIFLHIDELTLSNSGPDEKCRVDEAAMRQLRVTLEALTRRPDTVFVTLLQAREIIQGKPG